MSEASSWVETAQCSNRGICDGATGACGCFAGFTGEGACVRRSRAYALQCCEPLYDVSHARAAA